MAAAAHHRGGRDGLHGDGAADTVPVSASAGERRPAGAGVSYSPWRRVPCPQARQRARRGVLQEELTIMPRSHRRSAARTTTELAELTALRAHYAVALRELHAEARQLGRLLTAMETA